MRFNRIVNFKKESKKAQEKSCRYKNRDHVQKNSRNAKAIKIFIYLQIFNVWTY